MQPHIQAITAAYLPNALTCKFCKRFVMILQILPQIMENYRAQMTMIFDKSGVVSEINSEKKILQLNGILAYLANS